MSDLATRITEAARHLDVRHGPQDLLRGEARLHRRLVVHRRRRWIAGGLGVFAVVGLGVLWARPGRAPVVAQNAPPPRPADTQADRLVLAPEPGSSVRLAPDARLRPREAPTGEGARAGDVWLQLDEGTAHFDVQRRPERRFEIAAGQVVVRVLGTSFTLRRQGDGVHVAVQRGRVDVMWPHGHSVLDAGDSGLFPPPEPEAPAARLPPVRGKALRAHAAPRPAADKPRVDERDARADEPRPADESVDDVEELLAMADDARLAGAPARAVGPLRAVLARHPADPRAPLAAFTLGRLLLERLDRPRAAADAFADVRRLDPHSPLGADALAREVEAAARAGDSVRAAEAARVYERHHPRGDKLHDVRRWAGF